MASDLAFYVDSSPEIFESGVSYADPEDLVKEEELDDYDFEEPELDDEEHEAEAEGNPE